MQTINVQAAYLAALELLSALKEQGSLTASLARLRESLLLQYTRVEQWPASAPDYLRLLAEATAQADLLDQAQRAAAIAKLSDGIELTLAARPGEFDPLHAHEVLALLTLGGEPAPLSAPEEELHS